MTFVTTITFQNTEVYTKLFEEALRFLTCGFLRCAQQVPSPCSWPKLCDYVYPPFSDILVCLQYYSQLLRGSGRRLRLLFGLDDGCATLETWLSKNREIGLSFLRTTLAAETWTHRRQAKFFDSLPWLWATLPDTRVPLEYRRPTSMTIHMEP